MNHHRHNIDIELQCNEAKTIILDKETLNKSLYYTVHM